MQNDVDHVDCKHLLYRIVDDLELMGHALLLVIAKIPR